MIAQRALVTGASTGIGEVFARILASQGVDLVVVARDGERLDALAADVTERNGVTCEVLVGDLTDRDALERVATRIGAEEDPVDLVINNAGFGISGRLSAQDADVLTNMVELNVVALQRLTHAAVEAMLPRGAGGVINISSLGGYQPAPGFASYSATKAFVSSFTQAVHEELVGTGVKVMVVCPGFTRTEFQERAGAEEASKLPELVWQEADEVVHAALRDYEKGRAVSVPGLFNKGLATFASTAPGIAGRKISAFVLKR